MRTVLLILLFTIFSLTSPVRAKNPVDQYNDTLVVGYNINPPFTYIHNGKLEGISYRLWKKIIEDDTNTYYEYINLPLDSLLLGLKNNTINIALSPLTITSKRSRYIDFSVPYFVSNSSFLVKHTSNYKRFLDITSTIFSWRFFKVILFLLLMLSAFGFLVWIFERKANKEEFGGGFEGFLHGIWWSAVTMTTVGYGDKTPKTFGGRVVGLIWMFAAIILISTITASITSSLTVEKLELSSNEVTSYKKFKIGTVKNSATEFWLNDHFFPDIVTYHTFDQMIDGIRKDEVHIVAYDEPVLKYFLKKNNIVEFDLVNIKFNPSMYAFGFNEKIDMETREFISTRLLKNIESKEWHLLLAAFGLDTEP